MSKKFIGITIGPVFETLTLSSSPMALWFSSYIFSFIAKEICKEFVNIGVLYDEFVVPYVDENTFKSYSYVGLYHDRIIIRSENITLDQVKEIIEATKKNIAENISNDLEKPKDTVVIDYITNYLQIFAIEKELLEVENPIIELSKLLDAAELTKTHIPIETENYILSFMNNSNSENKNLAIKNCFLMKNILESESKEFPLLKKNRNVISLSDIANGNIASNLSLTDETKKNTKVSNYYAIVQADGDGIGEVIKSLIGKERFFSKSCLNFGAQASHQIYSYGGVPIYAGGDDLLFIAPLQGHNSKNIFELIILLSEIFNKNIKTDSSSPTISFGIAIQYYKFPLYEALSNAIELLFVKAKKFKGKNAVAINFQKHSGQSFGFVFRKEEELINKISKLIKEIDNTDNIDSSPALILHSVSKKIVENSKLFEVAIMNYMNKSDNGNFQLIDNLFNNIFDSEIHKNHKYSNFIEDIKELMKSIIKSNCNIGNEIIECISSNQSDIDKSITDNEIDPISTNISLSILKSIDSILRMVYFFNEEKKVITK